jgi:hypothetical protein
MRELAPVVAVTPPCETLLKKASLADRGNQTGVQRAAEAAVRPDLALG